MGPSFRKMSPDEMRKMIPNLQVSSCTVVDCTVLYSTLMVTQLPGAYCTVDRGDDDNPKLLSFFFFFFFWYWAGDGALVPLRTS